MDPVKELEQMEVSSDSDSSSGDDEAEKALISKAEELEKQLSDNKYLYDIHIELVNLYRQLGDLTSMRMAYERFREYFPLTPQLWLAWINDERKIANSEAEIKNIFTLFENAVEDYLSVNLWMEYVQFAIGATTLEATRQIVEKGLAAVGLHTADGSLLWDTLRELELAHLSLTEKETEQWKQQVTRIAEIFRRQLSVPLISMESTYKEWKTWLEQLPEATKIDTEPTEWGYKKALKALETYKPFEEKLQVTEDEAELLQIYREYVKVLSDPSTVICVYERAVAQMCLNVDIWVAYAMFAFKLGDAADKVSKRALRNCPWSQELWITRLRILEHLKCAESEVMSCFEEGVTTLGVECVDLWLAYLEYVFRNCSDKEKVYKSFEQALEQLQYLDDGVTKVTKWYARVLAKDGKMDTARKLWKNVLRKPQNRKVASIWLEFANLEKQYGDVGQLRSLFQRALTNCTDWPQFIAEEWLMFERENGGLSDIIACSQKQKEVIKIEPAKEPEVKKRKTEEAELPQPKKMKGDNYSPKKKQPVVKDPATTVFVSNLHTSVNEKRLKKVFPNSVNVEVVVDRGGRSRCYGYVQFGMEEEVMHALARDRELLDGRPIFISNCKPSKAERTAGFKYSQEQERNKLFVKGLPFDKKEDDIMGIFKGFNPKAVRLVRRRDGQSKGLAYVEFENEESAKKAINKTDQMKVGEFTISVAISAPPPKKPNVSKAAEPVRHARSKLQVSLVPRSVQVKSGASNGEGKVQGKSNDDFRKMLLNG